MNNSNSKKQKTGVSVLLCGACMSGNMGGQALYLSMIDSLHKVFNEDIYVCVLSKYPEDDREACEEAGWDMVPFKTLTQIKYGIPFFLIGSICRLIHLPWKWAVKGPLKEYCKHDILLDLSGISFTDDRNFSGLIINCLWLIPSLVTNLPYIKVSQAMGPFTRFSVKNASRFFLSRAGVLVSRGSISAKYLQELLPDRNIYELPDVAFLLKPSPPEDVEQVLVSLGIQAGQAYCVIGPSMVVDGLMNNENKSQSYSSLMANITDKLSEISSLPIILLPHERAHSGSITDDLNICRKIYQILEHKDNVYVLSEIYSSRLLKGIIAGAEMVVGSRFHFMVAAMSSGVPGMAITWSHKYYEMMEILDQGQYAINYLDADNINLLDRVTELWQQRREIMSHINSLLPGVIKRAEMNAILVKSFLEKS